MTPANTDVLSRLDRWANERWLRRLDSALATFVAGLDPDATPALLAAVAVLGNMEGKGHTCLALGELVVAPTELLGWPLEQHEELLALWRELPHDLENWVRVLGTSAVVACEGFAAPGPSALGKGATPLVLDAGGGQPRLYLRRYWNHERSIAAAVRQRTERPLEVDAPRARHWLDSLFDPAGAAVPWRCGDVSPSSPAGPAQARRTQRHDCSRCFSRSIRSPNACASRSPRRPAKRPRV